MPGISMMLGLKRKGMMFPNGSASWPSRVCFTSRKYLSSTRATALMTCWKASRRRSKETWKMLSWTWSSAFRTNPCILLTDCTTPGGIAVKSWLESWSLAVKWTCWKLGLNSREKYAKSLYYCIQQDTKWSYQKALLYLCGGDDWGPQQYGCQEWCSFSSS